MNQESASKRLMNLFSGDYFGGWYVECDCFSSNHHPARYPNPCGIAPESFTTNGIIRHKASIIGRLFLLLMIVLPVWCALHRIHHTCTI